MEAVYAGRWEQALDMGEAAVFSAVLDKAGLPTQAFLEHIGDPEVKAALVTSTDEAVARGVSVVPLAPFPC